MDRAPSLPPSFPKLLSQATFCLARLFPCPLFTAEGGAQSKRNGYTIHWRRNGGLQNQQHVKSSSGSSNVALVSSCDVFRFEEATENWLTDWIERKDLAQNAFRV